MHVLARWIERSRQRRQLAELSDAALHDMGLTRADVRIEIDSNGDYVDFSNVKVADNLKFLYRHLLVNNFLFGIECSDRELFNIFSRNVLKQLPDGRGEWEACLPPGIPEEIIDNHLFGYRD